MNIEEKYQPLERTGKGRSEGMQMEGPDEDLPSLQSHLEESLQFPPASLIGPAAVGSITLPCPREVETGWKAGSMQGHQTEPGGSAESVVPRASISFPWREVTCWASSTRTNRESCLAKTCHPNCAVAGPRVSCWQPLAH